MFGFLKKKSNKNSPLLLDLDGQELYPGDKVLAFRYELGECNLIREEGNYYYVSIKNNEKVSWLKMIDATTQNQKVRKILPM